MKFSIHRLRACAPILFCGVCCAALAGCGNADQLRVYPVRGKVLVSGKPAPGAFVALHPIDADEKLSRLRPHGRTDADGSFTLTTYEPGDGAPAAKYRATVEWMVSDEALQANEEILDPERSESETDRLKGRYSDVITTPLEVNIGSQENELPPFELK